MTKVLVKDHCQVFLVPARQTHCSSVQSVLPSYLHVPKGRVHFLKISLALRISLASQFQFVRQLVDLAFKFLGRCREESILRVVVVRIRKKFVLQTDKL